MCFAALACSDGTESSGVDRAQTGGTSASGGSVSLTGGSSSSGGTTGIDLDAASDATTIDEDCDNILEVTYRDFKESHPDFEMGFSGDVVRMELVQDTIGSDRKPVFNDSIGCPRDENTHECSNWTPTQAVITSADTFDQWYRTVSDVNLLFEKQLTLTETSAGSGQYVYDSTEFFPLEPGEGWGVTPANNDMGRNFLFTTEIHLKFGYVAGQVFTFRGDDDLWIFVNDKLAMDIGSMHVAAEGTIDFDAQAAELGISPGGTYSMDIFHAERHTRESNFRFETNIACFTPVVVK